MKLGRSAGVTDTGRRRRGNEDSYVCQPPLFAIADGMGGAQAGEVASRLAAAVLREADGAELSESRIVELIQEANRRVFQRSNEDAATSGMGTTMTVALVDRAGAKITFGHVGDSRAYRVRDGRLEQLTDDHSLVGELVRSGKLSPEEAEMHPQRSVITRALGTEPDVDVDTFTIAAEPGDVFLLCSDGLTDMLADTEIESLIAGGERDPEPTARRLIEAANSSGGEDNITVVVFEIVEDSAPDRDETVTMLATQEPHEPADEDTLSGLEGVPAVQTAVLSAAEIEEALRQEEARVQAREEATEAGVNEEEAKAEAPTVARPIPPQPQAPRRRLLPLLLLLLLLAAIAVLVIWGLNR